MRFRAYMIVLEDEKKVDELMKIAANHNLGTQYKIGVYGNTQQHELYLMGRFFDYLSFKHDIKPKNKVS